MKKTITVTFDEFGKIDVSFSGAPCTHSNIKNAKRAIDVNFRVYHYRLRHNNEKETANLKE